MYTKQMKIIAKESQLADIESVLSANKSIKKWLCVLHEYGCYSHYHVIIDFERKGAFTENVALWFNIPSYDVTHIFGGFDNYARYLLDHPYKAIKANFDYTELEPKP